MQTGAKISAVGHGALVALALFGLPWFGPREREPIRVTEVSFVTEAEFDAAQATADAAAPRAEDAPAAPPRARPAPAPDVAEPAPAAPEQAVAVLEPPAAVEVPDPSPVTPRVATVAPPTAAAPPRSRPAPRVEPNPTPPPEEDLRPAEAPEPVRAPEPEPAPEVVEETPAAPPEAAPEAVAEATPPAPLALETSGRPKPRQVERERPPDAAAAVMAAVRQEAERREATPPTPPSETPATEPSPAAEPAEAEATSLPVGPPMTNAEKDGLKLAVQRCWNVPAGLRDAQDLKVTLAAELAADGQVISASIRLIEPRSAPDARFQQAYEAGRRALIRCSPYAALPRDKFAQWRNIEVVFNPEGMVSW